MTDRNFDFPPVLNCQCRHKEPWSTTCPHDPPNTCGGSEFCALCAEVITVPVPLEPPAMPPMNPDAMDMTPPEPLAVVQHVGRYGQWITEHDSDKLIMRWGANRRIELHGHGLSHAERQLLISRLAGLLAEFA